MKPNFALKLSYDSVEILHRTASGWIVTGSSRFDVADLEAAMAKLRADAESRDPGGLRSKLIIPDSEVRYATVLAPGPTDEARQHQIEAEIEGLTPYTLNDLAYDYVVEGDHALVAICAREILSEAEDFAQTHGFNPVSFVAMPQGGHFIGEPFFGETSCARAFLAPATRVQRDTEAVRIVNRSDPAAKGPATLPPRTTSVAAAPTAVASAREASGKEAPQRASHSTGPTAPKPESGSSATAIAAGTAARAAATVTAAAPEAFSRVGNLVRRMGTRIRREQAQSAAALGKPAQPKSAQADPVQTNPVQARQSAATAAPSFLGGKPAEGPRAGTATARPSPAVPAARTPADPGDRPPEGRASDASTTVADAASARPGNSRSAADTGTAIAASGAKPPEGPAPTGANGSPVPSQRSDAASAEKAAPVTFASRRRASPAAAGPTLASSGPGAPRRETSAAGGRIAVFQSGAEKSGPGRLTRLYRRGRRAGKGVLARLGLAGGSGATTSKRTIAAPRPAGPRDTEKAAALQPIVPASRPPTDEREKASEAESLTIFGARSMQRTETGFARRGMMLAGGLFLLLVAVAVWAVYFTTSPTTNPQVALLPQEEATPLPGIVAPTQVPEPEASSTPQPPAEEPGTQPVAAAVEPAPEDIADAGQTTAATPEPAPAATDTPPIDAPDPVTDPDALLEQLVQEALDGTLPAELLDRADEVSSQASPDSATTLSQTEAGTPDESTLTATDTPQIATDADPPATLQLGLPQRLEPPQIAEVEPVSPPPPPPFGVEFTLGPDGLVEATPEGAMTPGGVMVYAGRPSEEVPPVRPAALAPEPEPSADAEVETEPQSPDPEAETAEVIADDTPRADPALANTRPEPRSPRVAAMAAAQSAEPATDSVETPQSGPEAETEPLTADPNDDSSALTPPPGGVSLDTLRPQRRPTDLVPPTRTAAAVETADEVENGAESEQIAAEAVASSLRPSARPGDLSARVQEALAAARAPATTTTAPAQPAAAAAPNIPTSASVAQQATQTRALNLRRVNLIGVFGTPNDRRALVRLSNGQVVRVQVGDTLDGGRVSAIGDDELRYVKNGRNEVLRIGSSG